MPACAFKYCTVAPWQLPTPFGSGRCRQDEKTRGGKQR
jgi:hypothetical protein